MDMDFGPKIVSGVSPPPSNSSDKHSPVPLIIVGIESPRPDPRWPSKFRWSEKSDPPSTTVVKTQLVAASDASPSPASFVEPPTLSDSPNQPATQAEPSLDDITSELVSPVASASLTSPVEMPLDDVFLNIVSPMISTKTILTNPLEAPIEPLVDANLSKSSRQGAWAKPLSILATRQLGKEVVRESLTASQKQMDRMEDNLRFPWAAKMDPASRNLYRALEPEYLPDGTPKVTIPQHVLLQGLENQKEYILGQFYRCLPPPGGLIFAVFNKLWGRKCRITIRKLGESSYLFHIPDESTSFMDS
ncbi:unnamed protein product [Arabidopsis arenosa]|uniref:DUF4283 domain-containing protein n=1 Tax=Arabidopsis arenosa TaxID=38785 RepID=A0A8S1ZV91_ARAAE|nr:unnamed protein product [Arabidopsis arenosa]